MYTQSPPVQRTSLGIVRTRTEGQLLFSNDHKKYARDRWLKIEKELNISKIQIQRLMQNKKEFTYLLNKSYAWRQFKWYKVPNK